jgi:predicted GNAT family N-acyltransferase
MNIQQPRTDEDWEQYFSLRWRILRKPWNQPIGSERDELDSSAFHLALKDESGRVLAIGRLHLNSATEAQVRYMAVEPDCRRLGAGSRILRALEAHAVEKGAGSIVLNAREEALTFYSRHGYAEKGPGPTLFGQVRHVRMEKALSGANPASSSNR